MYIVYIKLTDNSCQIIFSRFKLNKHYIPVNPYSKNMASNLSKEKRIDYK